MTTRAPIDGLLRDLQALAPAGYFAALRVRLLAPQAVYTTYPAHWLARYAEAAYALRDPVSGWAVARLGHQRWEALAARDPDGILADAARHGLAHGAVASAGPAGSRSWVCAAREDRPLSDAECKALEALAVALHAAHEPVALLTPAQAQALRLVAEGLLHAQAAAELGISESALKARLTAARERLDARNTTEAIQRARNLALF